MAKKPNRISFALKQFVKAFSSYDAVKNTRYRANRGSSQIRSEELELKPYDRDRLISAALEFKRNNPVVNSMSRLRKTDIVGKGILPQPKTGNDDLDNEILDKWQEFSLDPEVTGCMDMRELQQQMIDSLLFYGDCGLIFTKQGVQFIDGSRIGNPIGGGPQNESSPIQNGVEISNIGRPLKYYVGSRVNGSLVDINAIPAKDFIMFFRRNTPIQYRGIPELAPILNTLQDCDEYDKVEMISAKVSASLAVAVKRETSYEYELQNRMDADEQDSIGNLEQFEPGRFHYLEPGEDVSVISSGGRPNVDGIEWVNYLLRKVGSAVGIPTEFLLMDIGGSSFSASQGVVLQYQQTIESYQNDLIRALDKLYRRWITQQYLLGNLKGTFTPDSYKVRWQRPAFRWVNRIAQVKSDLEYYRLGAMSLDDVTSTFGYTAEEVMVRKAQNIKQAKEIANKFELDSWRELINPYPTSVSSGYADVFVED